MLTEVNKGDIMISKSTEEYLKTIYLLKREGSDVSVTNIAFKIGCSKPSVTKQLNILSNSDMIDYKAYGDIILTTKGEMIAKKILASYDILYLLMHDVIGLDKDESSLEAEKIKGVLKEDTINEIAKYVYTTLGLDLSNCNYKISSEKCRECFKKKKETIGSDK